MGALSYVRSRSAAKCELVKRRHKRALSCARSRSVRASPGQAPSSQNSRSNLHSRHETCHQEDHRELTLVEHSASLDSDRFAQALSLFYSVELPAISSPVPRQNSNRALELVDFMTRSV